MFLLVTLADGYLSVVIEVDAGMGGAAFLFLFLLCFFCLLSDKLVVPVLTAVLRHLTHDGEIGKGFGFTHRRMQEVDCVGLDGQKWRLATLHKGILVTGTESGHDIEFAIVVPVYSHHITVREMFVDEIIQHFCLFIGKSLVIAILHSTQCPFRNMVGTKVFQVGKFAADG